MATIFDVLEEPGTSHTFANTHTHSLATVALRVHLWDEALEGAQRAGRAIPTSIVLCPDLVSTLYSGVKSRILEEERQRFPAGLPAPPINRIDLITLRNFRSDARHTDEASAIDMDKEEIINPSLRCINCYLLETGGDAEATFRGQQNSSSPQLDYFVYRTGSRDRVLLLWEHISAWLSLKVLDELSLISDLARTQVPLTYSTAQSLQPMEIERLTVDDILKMPRDKQSASKCLKALTVIEKTILYMVRENCNWSIISSHEHWIFLENMQDGRVAVSNPIPCTSTNPPLAGTVFALLVMPEIQPATDGRWRIESTTVTTQEGFSTVTSTTSAAPPGARVPPSSRSERPMTRAYQRELGTADTLWLVCAFLRQDCPTSLADPQKTMASFPFKAIQSALLRARTASEETQIQDANRGASTPNSEVALSTGEMSQTSWQNLHDPPHTSPTSFLAASQSSDGASRSWIALHSLVATGGYASVYRLHHSKLLCKVFGPEEGWNFSYEGEWRLDFEAEVQAYARLKAVQGTAVPRFFGAFESINGGGGMLLLEDCGNAVGTEEGFGHLDRASRRRIYEVAAQVAATGVLHADFEPRNIVEDEGRFTVIDFGRSYFTSDPAVQKAWLKNTAEVLDIDDSEMLQ